MADSELENPIGYIDIRRNSKGQDLGTASPGTQNAAAATAVDEATFSSLKAALQTANAGYYTNARINSMTKNDMVYALRQTSNAAGIR